MKIPPFASQAGMNFSRHLETWPMAAIAASTFSGVPHHISVLEIMNDQRIIVAGHRVQRVIGLRMAVISGTRS